MKKLDKNESVTAAAAKETDWKSNEARRNDAGCSQAISTASTWKRNSTNINRQQQLQHQQQHSSTTTGALTSPNNNNNTSNTETEQMLLLALTDSFLSDIFSFLRLILLFTAVTSCSWKSALIHQFF